jgi:hypothetical protein
MRETEGNKRHGQQEGAIIRGRTNRRSLPFDSFERQSVVSRVQALEGLVDLNHFFDWQLFSSTILNMPTPP